MAARILENEYPLNAFCLSLQQYPVGDSRNINNGMRAADGSGDTVGLQEKAQSRGMRYLVNITQINFMLPQETHNHKLVRIHFETKTRREKAAPHAPSRVGAWFGPFSVLQCVTAHGCGGQRRATKEDRVNTTTCMPGTCTVKTIFIDDEKAMLILM